MQQQLFVASFTQHEPTVFLHSWASEIQKTNSKWRDILLEALCIIQAKAIIRKLGLNYNDLEQRFLPLNPYNTVFVHPIVKLLYFVSEQLTVLESRQLIDRTVSKFKICENFKYTDNGERLEIYFMYWLTEDVLSIGRKTATIGNSIDEPKLQFPCNLEPIVEFLKQNEKDALKEIVSAVCRQFNSTRIAPTDRPTICTDENRPIDMDYTSCNFKGKNIQPNNTEHSYKIRKLNAGIVLIVNQNMFHHDKDPDLREHLPTRMLETRYGSDQDVSKLQSTFAAFGYRIEIRENLNDNDLLKAVRDVVIECAGKDSLIVCILSHGYKGVVYGANSIPVKITDIKDLMTSEKLISIPKILIVQACQGDVTQQAREVCIDYYIISFQTHFTCFNFLLHFLFCRLITCITMAQPRIVCRKILTLWRVFQPFQDLRPFGIQKMARGSFKRFAIRSQNWPRISILLIYLRLYAAK